MERLLCLSPPTGSSARGETAVTREPPPRTGIRGAHSVWAEDSQTARSGGRDDPDLGTVVDRGKSVVRAHHHLPWHPDRPPIGVQVEPVGELPVLVATGIRVDGAEKVAVRGIVVGEDRPRPLVRLGDREMPGSAGHGVDYVHHDRDREPGGRRNPRPGRDIERRERRVDPQVNVRACPRRRDDDVRFR